MTKNGYGPHKDKVLSSEHCASNNPGSAPMHPSPAGRVVLISNHLAIASVIFSVGYSFPESLQIQILTEHLLHKAFPDL